MRDKRQERQKLTHLKELKRYTSGKEPIVGSYGNVCCPGQECQKQQKAKR